MIPRAREKKNPDLRFQKGKAFQFTLKKKQVFHLPTDMPWIVSEGTTWPGQALKYMVHTCDKGYSPVPLCYNLAVMDFGRRFWRPGIFSNSNLSYPKEILLLVAIFFRLKKIHTMTSATTTNTRMTPPSALSTGESGQFCALGNIVDTWGSR